MADQTDLARKAARKLKRIMLFKPLVQSHGLCTLRPEPDLFRVLISSIIAQLISTKAARTIQSRFEALLPAGLTPGEVAQLTEQQIRGCGLSGAKTRAIQDLTQHYLQVPDFSAQVHSATDEEARQLLLPLRGIGPWTVDMVLMFGLGRPDILPVGDLGLRAAVQEQLGWVALPTAAELAELAEPWRPYRTIATWYLWRSRGWVPQSEGT